MLQHGVVALFSFGRRHVADGLQEPPVVEPVYPFQRRELDGLERAPWPASVHDLSFVKTVDRLGEGIVVTVADAADGWLDAGLGEALGVSNADVLRPSVRMMHETTSTGGPSFVQGLLQG